MSSTPNAQILAATQQLTGQVVNEFFTKRLLFASDESLYSFLQFNATALQRLHNHPEDCGAFFVGSGAIDLKMLPADFLEHGLDIKADVIESSINNPTPASKAKDFDEFTDPLVAAYQRNGYKLEDIANVFKISQFPAADGCRIATSFIASLASLDKAKASFVFKNWMLL